MPIRELTTPQGLGLQPTEIGVESTAAAARRGGAFFNQAAQDITGLGHEVGSTVKDVGQVALEYENHREISAGQKDLAARINNLTETWNNTVKNADPNDPSVAAKFREEVLEPELESFTGNFHTEAAQNWAQTHVGQLRQHMFEKTAADMSTMAGQAARVNHVQTVNFLSKTAMNDPSSLDFALKTLEGSTAASIDSNPNLKGTVATGLKAELAERGREQIVKAAAQGYIEKTGQVPPWATDPKYSKYINGAELRMFQKNAEAQQKSNEWHDRQIAREKKLAADLNVAKGLNDVFTNSVSVDPNDSSKVRIAPDAMQKVLDVVRSNPDAPTAAEHARTTINWLEHQQAQKATQSDPQVKTGLYNGMFSPDKATSDIDIYRAEVEGKLSRSDAAAMLQLNKALTDEPLKGPIYQDTMKAAHAALVVNVPGIPGKDVTGEANYAKFVQNFIPDYLAKKRAGTLPANALDINDPNSLISQHVKTFHRTLTQRMNDYTELLGGLPSTAPTSARGVTTNLTGPNTVTLPRVNTKAAYDALAPGAEFTDDNGNRWTKPEKKK